MIILCGVWYGETFGGTARKASGIVSFSFSLEWYGKSNVLIFFIISYQDFQVSNHNLLLLLNLFRNNMITQVLVELEHLNQLLFEHFVNI